MDRFPDTFIEVHAGREQAGINGSSVGMDAKDGRFCHLLPWGITGTGEMDIRYPITRHHHREPQAP